MTPSARLAAAIEVLDRILAGAHAERALTNWGRASRFAGSGDRAAVRDIVFDALRRRRSAAALGGGLTGRGLVLGLCRDAGQEALFTGVGHAPLPPGPDEQGRTPVAAEALDVPDWLLPKLRESLGADTEAVLLAMRNRAPVFVRVNLRKATLASAVAALAGEGITATPHALAPACLELGGQVRKLQTSAAYLEGWVELQDASSQAVVEALPLADGMRVLDHCAGGGGKSLAMAAQADLQLFAHDIAPQRMADLPRRADRAGVDVTLTAAPEDNGPYDLVLVDAPCSGLGSWRRDPEGKWALTPERLAELVDLQARILQRAAGMVRPGGCLAYATCSMLRDENSDQVTSFLAKSAGWTLERSLALTPLTGGDGFYLATLRRV
ncbi:RsmB/NOP family class I SAM-dependent RNA methyltransferase [Tabrizicola piscis]|uniref:RsmB/NOP family class I SAM-dependent RNA methyltransferase n=1 Tax=Tabrizicola piscis TaxID=2494374 RepID=A0A3S8U1D8_9RHOB|nr:RsmB/NOP family class I SAM-dependent RNA methyltransferase [Tabrizicola piscis]AZL57410.1 RsmB/NOP family class I SAM-dependent RNA methyltransferase [Tabrizicola piscis]